MITDINFIWKILHKTTPHHRPSINRRRRRLPGWKAISKIRPPLISLQEAASGPGTAHWQEPCLAVSFPLYYLELHPGGSQRTGDGPLAVSIYDTFVYVPSYPNPLAWQPADRGRPAGRNHAWRYHSPSIIPSSIQHKESAPCSQHPVTRQQER